MNTEAESSPFLFTCSAVDPSLLFWWELLAVEMSALFWMELVGATFFQFLQGLWIIRNWVMISGSQMTSSFMIFRRRQPMSSHKWEIWVSQNDFFIFELCMCVQVTQGPEKPVLAVLTDRDLLLYPSLPESKESLSSPTKSHPLIATRLHHVKFFMRARLFSFSLGFCFTLTWHINMTHIGHGTFGILNA